MSSLAARGLVALLASSALANKAAINSDLVLTIDGKKIFPIGFTLPPPPNGKTPEGKNGIAELAAAGATFLRTGGRWTPESLAREQEYMDAAARHGLYCLSFLREAATVDSPAREAQLRSLINRFKNHPGLGAWKGDDEPAWGKKPIPPLLRGYEIIKELDPNHPVALIHAPRGTVEDLKKYNGTADIVGADIYPIAYPPGHHSDQTNKSMSLVGDHTRMMTEVAEGKKPVWMVLQIAWSGVIKPGKTLRMPTFPEERFMTYEAIINGARGLVYFGGNLAPAMNARDRALGWNWTFWQRVLRPVIEEIGSHSPLYPALVAPDFKTPVHSTGTGIELLARQAGDDFFLLVCKRQGETEQITLEGLPPSLGKGTVLYENREIAVREGKFPDWIAPYEVHAYRFPLRAAD